MEYSMHCIQDLSSTAASSSNQSKTTNPKHLQTEISTGICMQLLIYRCAENIDLTTKNFIGHACTTS